MTLATSTSWNAFWAGASKPPVAGSSIVFPAYRPSASPPFSLSALVFLPASSMLLPSFLLSAKPVVLLAGRAFVLLIWSSVLKAFCSLPPITSGCLSASMLLAFAYLGLLAVRSWSGYWSSVWCSLGVVAALLVWWALSSMSSWVCCSTMVVSGWGPVFRLSFAGSCKKSFGSFLVAEVCLNSLERLATSASTLLSDLLALFDPIYYFYSSFSSSVPWPSNSSTFWVALLLFFSPAWSIFWSFKNFLVMTRQ